MAPRIVGLFAGGPAFVKEARASARVDGLGVHGDRHYGRSTDRALLLVPEASYDALREGGLDLPYGSLGENLVVSEMPAAGLAPGTRLDVGGVACEVVEPCPVCRSLAGVHPRLPKLAYGRRGVYLRVRDVGRLQRGDAVRIVGGPGRADPVSFRGDATSPYVPGGPGAVRDATRPEETTR